MHRSASGATAPCALLLLASLAYAAPAPQQPRVPAHARPSPGGLTAFRPQNRAAYAPFARTAVPESLEEDPALGPGIRVNGAGETDPAGEDDLIEVVVGRPMRDRGFVLARSGSELVAWTTRDKQPGSELAFTAGRTAPLAFGADGEITVWIERTSAAPALSALELRAEEPDAPFDRLVFHAFTGLVVALGGESQVPGVPLDANHGTFVVASELYGLGWDVLMRDEDEVSADGSGLVYTEVVNAIQRRAVGELAVFGYSHGGGSTHDLCERLNLNRPSIGTFAIEFTSYVDGVQNDSDVDVDRETRFPPSSGYHANHYQVGTFADFFLDGGPVNGSFPAPSGLNVETTPWGAGADHFVVDDFTQVRSFVLSNLEARVAR